MARSHSSVSQCLSVLPQFWDNSESSRACSFLFGIWCNFVGGLQSVMRLSMVNNAQRDAADGEQLSRVHVRCTCLYLANILSSNSNPLVERYAKDSASQTFILAHSQQSSGIPASQPNLLALDTTPLESMDKTNKEKSIN
jgi:hypothetical protein